MFDLEDCVDARTAHYVTLMFHTIGMMISFMMAVASCYEIALGRSHWNILWYIVLYVITRWCMGQVRKDWDEIRRLA